MLAISFDLILISIQAQITSKCFYMINFEQTSHTIFSGSSLFYQIHRFLREKKKREKIEII